MKIHNGDLDMQNLLETLIVMTLLCMVYVSNTYVVYKTLQSLNTTDKRIECLI